MLKISKFSINNFKNLQDVSFTFEDYVLLIGENNTGKSSILYALDWFLGGKQIKNKNLFRNGLCDEDNAIELTAHFFNLTDNEKGAIAVSGRMYNDEWILKKKFWLTNSNGVDKWEEKYFSYQEIIVFEDWPEAGRSWGDWPIPYNDYIQEVKAEVGNANVTNASRELLKCKIIERAPHLFTMQNDWNPNPGGGGNWKSNANSITPEFIFVPAVLEITTETQAKSTTIYGKIINFIIEKKLLQRDEFKELSKQMAKVKALFTPDANNPDWEQAPEIKELEENITSNLSNIISAKAIIDTKDLDLTSVLMPTTILKIDDGYITDVAEQGHGLQRSLIISLLQILNLYSNEESNTPESDLVSRSVIFGIEEPEIYLHPQMIRKMKDVLIELSDKPNYQIICSSHSPVFIDMADRHRSIVRLQKNEERLVTAFQVHEEMFSGEEAEDKKNQLRMIIDFDSKVNEIFFSNNIVLVEGDTEVALFQKTAELLNFFSSKEQMRDTTFINCHGKDSIENFIPVLNHFEINYLVVHDIDKRNDPINTNISNLVKENSRIITFDPDIEGILGFSTKRNKPIKALNKIKELHQTNTISDEFINKAKQIFGVENVKSNKSN